MVDEITCKKDLGKFFSIESIFKWKPTVLEENLQDYEFEPQENNKFNFMNFVIRFAKCYYVHFQDMESALEMITELEKKSAKNPIDEDDSYNKIRDAVIHVILATKCSIMMKTKKNEVSEILNKIKPFDDLDSCNKAAVNAIRSAVLALYSNEDMEKAFGYIDKALTLDSKNARWAFLKGLYVRKVRRLANPFEAPSLQEKALFEEALKLDPNNVAFVLHVADVYREITAHAAKRQNMCTNFLPRDNTLNSNLKGNIDQKIQKAKEYYQKAAETYDNSTYVMFHAAEGLLKLPHPHSDVKLARKLLKAGLKKSPKSAEGNFVMAFCYERFDKNSEQAKNHLRICQELKFFDAELYMIRIQYAEKLPSFDNVETLLNLLQKYHEKPRHAIIYSQLVSYYLFVEYDLIKACNYATKFYSLSTTSSCMQVHRSVFIPTPEPFALIDVLTDEVKFKMWGKQTPKPLRDVCEKFIHFMNFQNVKIIKGYPQNFRKQILEGKPLVINPKCMTPFQKNSDPKREVRPNPRANASKPNNRQDPRNLSEGRGPPGKPNKRDHPSTTREFFDRWRDTEKNKTSPVSKLPSLMDSLTINPRNVEPVVEKDPVKETKPSEQPREEKHRKERPEKESSRSSSIDSSDEKLVKAFLKALKKKKHTRERRHDHKSKSSRRRRSPSTTSESEDDFSQAMIKRLLADKKSDRRKKYRSDSDDSKYRKRRDRPRRRHSYSDSDDSSRHRGRKHDRHHKRDFSPRSRRGRKSDSTDSEFGFKLKPKNRREDRRSSDRQSRRDYSPRNERDDSDRYNRTERSPSADTFSVRSKKHRDRRSISKDKTRKRIERSPSVDQSSAARDDLPKVRSKNERSRRSVSKDRISNTRNRRDRSPSTDRFSVRSDVTKSRSKKERDRRSVSKDRLSSRNCAKKATKKRDRRSPSLPPSGDSDSESNSSRTSRS